jgi:hypothetical protein
MVPKLRVLANVAPGIAIEGLGALGLLPGIALGRKAGESIVLRLRGQRPHLKSWWDTHVPH